MKNSKFKIGKVLVSNTNFEHAIKSIENAVKNKDNTYICVSNMRMVRLGNKDKSYRKVMNSAYMALPDGLPLTWCGRLWGLKEVSRVTGPDLFQVMLNKKENGLKHFLLGDTEDILTQIKEKYKGCNIVGSYSPPFADVEDFDYKYITELVNNSNADVVWVAMRAPKQDIFSANISPLLQNKICIGVGRAFRIAMNNIKDAPQLAKKIGIAGIFTRRLSFFKTLIWYLESFFYLLYYFIQILFLKFIYKIKTQK